MAGVKGRSGGQRMGAGRPKNEAVKLNLPASTDPQAFLLAVMNDTGSDAKLRVDAAKALMPFIHAKKGEGGKKEEAANAAKKAGTGKFKPGSPPRLVANNQTNKHQLG